MSTYPPGPKHLLPFKLYREYSRDTLGLLTRLAREYGDVAHASFFGQHVVLLSHPDHIQDVLVTQHRTFDKANVKIRYLMPEGLSSVVADEHKRQRHLLQPALLREHVKVHAGIMAQQAGQLGETWHDGAVIDMNAAMMRLTQTIVGKALFDADVAAETEEVSHALTDVLEAPRYFFSGKLAPLLRQLPLRGARQAEAARAHLHAIVERLIAQHRQGDDRPDLLGQLLKWQRAQGPDKLSDDLIRDNVLNLFLAGHETSANGLTWCWHLLATHPEIQERLHDEARGVLGGRLPTADDLPKLPYAEMVFAEALRLYPPVWTIVRTALTDCTAAGYALPAGTTILMCQYVVQRDARFYPEPERFDPEHMTHAARAARPRFAYFPFGGGPRQCIGESFAWQEAILVLATLIQQWRVQPAGAAAVVPEPYSTLRPKGGMPLRLQRRR